jgi:hypothetical protein
VSVVVGEVVGDAGGAAVQVAAAELLGAHDLAGRRLHQRRAAQEDGALVPHDDGLVAHRRDVGATGRAGAEDRGDLRDAARRQLRLVEEDPAEVLPVGEDLVLLGQERPARVDQVDARQAVLERHLLGPQVLLHRHRVVGAALDGRVVRDDHDLPAADPADAGDDPRGRGVAVVQPVRREGDSSRKGLPGSSSASTRSRGSSLPRSTWRARARSPPPWAAVDSSARRSSTSARWAVTFRAQVSPPGFAAEPRTGATGTP